MGRPVIRRFRTQIIVGALLAMSMVSGTAIARNGDRLLRLLRRQVYFTTGVGKGAPGPTSIQRAFSSMVRQRRSGDFLALTTSDESVARLYGLCGLRHLDAPEYADVYRRLGEDGSAVSAIVGCFGVNDTVGGILAHEFRKWGKPVFDIVCKDLVLR